MTTTYTNSNGRTFTSAVRLPFVAVVGGRVAARRATLAAIVAAAPAGARLFFDYSPGCGTLVR